ncbi:hypothetical protein HZF24_04825 [Sedimentibacter hydroxybenzoicus DSM 7310]|uniref:Uncharacterized protein n=1 Tax=Sedimentibacter hydroxybenzoicus DSM 7310 TaxID=1123245 RepID=A0A974BHW0_SEDHY|nr:hypothetical protein [Sedimentibacter hydroxybenzoicus]NYB73458.1 hypothetical protein [Sedimentibacter hydroxybenzoicus DSM 7310]
MRLNRKRLIMLIILTTIGRVMSKYINTEEIVKITYITDIKNMLETN